MTLAFPDPMSPEVQSMLTATRLDTSRTPLLLMCVRVQDWDAQLRGLTAKAAAYDRQYESALRSLDAIKPGVHSIFQKLGSTDPALTEALAASGVTDSNVMQHLASVEQRVNEIMQVRDWHGLRSRCFAFVLYWFEPGHVLDI